MVAKTTAAKKAKGRALQKWVQNQLLALFPSLQADDVRSTSMGASGEDVQLSPAARRLFPYNVECKNTEKLNVWAAYDQAKAHGKAEPLVIMKKNGKKPLAVLDAQYFFNLHKG